MIRLTHLNKNPFYLNSDLILMVEETPDTLIHMTSGEKMLVKESAREVVDLVVAFKRRVNEGGVCLNVTQRTVQSED